MKTYDLSLPQLALIAGTRGMAGAGLGMLIADRVSQKQRRAVGWALLAVGALTTIPLLIQVLQSKKEKGVNGSSLEDKTLEPEAIGAELQAGD